MAPVDLNLYPSYAYVVEYPIDLSTIKARLENRFYRRVTAVQYDVRCIYMNACKFNQPKSDIVRHASIITDLCLEMIRNPDETDPTAAYHRLVENYRAIPDDVDDAPGPSSSRSTKKNGITPAAGPSGSGSAATTSSAVGHKTRSRSRRNSPADSDDSNSDAGNSRRRDKSFRAASAKVSLQFSFLQSLR